LFKFPRIRLGYKRKQATLFRKGKKSSVGEVWSLASHRLVQKVKEKQVVRSSSCAWCREEKTYHRKKFALPRLVLGDDHQSHRSGGEGGGEKTSNRSKGRFSPTASPKSSQHKEKRRWGHVFGEKRSSRKGKGGNVISRKPAKGVSTNRSTENSHGQRRFASGLYTPNLKTTPKRSGGCSWKSAGGTSMVKEVNITT